MSTIQGYVKREPCSFLAIPRDIVALHFHVDARRPNTPFRWMQGTKYGESPKYQDRNPTPKPDKCRSKSIKDCKDSLDDAPKAPGNAVTV